MVRSGFRYCLSPFRDLAKSRNWADYQGWWEDDVVVAFRGVSTFHRDRMTFLIDFQHENLSPFAGIRKVYGRQKQTSRRVR